MLHWWSALSYRSTAVLLSGCNLQRPSGFHRASVLTLETRFPTSLTARKESCVLDLRKILRRCRIAPRVLVGSIVHLVVHTASTGRPLYGPTKVAFGFAVSKAVVNPLKGRFPEAALNLWGFIDVFGEIQRNAEEWFGSPAPSTWGPLAISVADVPLQYDRNDTTNVCSYDYQRDTKAMFKKYIGVPVPAYSSNVLLTPQSQYLKKHLMPVFMILQGCGFGHPNSFQEVFHILRAGEKPFDDLRIVWRGVVMNDNRRHIEAVGEAHDDMLDIGRELKDGKYQGGANWLTAPERARYKYQLTSFGSAYPPGCPGYEDRTYWVLFMNRVVFSPLVSLNESMTPRMWHTKDLEYCHDLKKDPERGCHIVPVQEDYSDLYEKYTWLEQNPSTYDRIRRNLNLFARQSLTPGRAYQYLFEDIMGGKAIRSATDIAMSDFGRNQAVRYAASAWGGRPGKCAWAALPPTAELVDL
eukprot:gnl/TRDRNA2_/TRDRNA2_165262_c1_seq1.p1 gnl/TRDRNA2_/TRDRNA2_165262_c1~~gnl/TRDRNA2_/TRDRNA2_165262_c1_seq1.p1  ORF type:complete len:468 (+),score=31.85 gnl/TRDRNA2_/TRDRNA2_165262_c1_seq1:67-1470(+)